MREVVFIRRNQERWHSYEHQPAATPEELAARFVALTDDLAYARTFYPTAPVTQHLNQLASRFHEQLYRRPTARRRGFGYFWLTELPLLVARHWKPLLTSLVLFLLFAGLGALSAAEDDAFVRLVLGDGYVNMTLENIRRGRPTDVYGTAPEVEMFLFIAYNNVRVALATFALGATAGLGTLYLLFRNAVMVGSFQYFFIAQGVGLRASLAIWLHGTIEISCIVLAAGAGLVLGSSLLFPGSYPRGEALRRGAQDAMKLMAGLVPLIVLAAFLEGFVTRLAPRHPVGISAPVIVLSLVLIVGYFVVYPWLLHHRARRTGFVLPDADAEAP
ncbi:stage II sporulation protein M [Hymenobacter jeollabukensis]|uniref:Stage II sporulation protein M n=1 Tax=Hymenobacter jeollabukensis TaxID=2025313 RepID=A0A5R8WM63_9BACT|nr:stage II sporulation protein M [Hymenobacter jeollabukensis]TLM89977.1 stage II sporulation protein M [Hymenobacter jeollabukensis]